MRPRHFDRGRRCRGRYRRRGDTGRWHADRPHLGGRRHHATVRDRLKVGRHGDCIGVALIGALRQRPLDDLLQGRGERRRGVENCRHRIEEVRLHEARQAVGHIGQTSGERLIQDDAKRVQVCPAVNRLALPLFRAHISRGADHALGQPRRCGTLGDFGNPKVRDIGFARIVEKDIGRLEIAVDNALGMGIVDGRSDSGEDVGHGPNRERPVLEPIGERTAGHIAHDDERLAVLLAVVVHRHDAAVLEHRHGPRLAIEAGAKSRVKKHLARQNLDGHRSSKAGIVGLEDGSHSAPSKFAVDFVASNCLHALTPFRL